MSFYFLVLLHAAYFWGVSHPVSVFPETNIGSAEKGSVKDEGRLLTAYAYEALTLWACIHILNFTNANLPAFYLGLLATVSLSKKREPFMSSAC